MRKVKSPATRSPGLGTDSGFGVGGMVYESIMGKKPGDMHQAGLQVVGVGGNLERQEEECTFELLTCTPQGLTCIGSR